MPPGHYGVKELQIKPPGRYRVTELQIKPPGRHRVTELQLKPPGRYRVTELQIKPPGHYKQAGAEPQCACDMWQFRDQLYSSRPNRQGLHEMQTWAVHACLNIVSNAKTGVKQAVSTIRRQFQFNQG